MLVPLDALLQQRSVTRAAEQLMLSQPALSASLARLRRHFDDPLLVRVGNAYQLTPLAEQLAERTRVLLADVDRVFSAEPDFDPGTTTREFTMLTSDYSCTVLAPRIVALLEAEAPRARLRLAANTPRVVETAERSLLSTDLMVMPHGFLSDLPHQDLHRDEWVCVVASENTEVGEELTLEQARTMPWVACYHGPTAATPAARQMRMLGLEQRITVVTENFVTVPGLVAGSGRVGLLQQRLVDALPPGAGVRAVPCPVEVGPLIEAMWWHPSYTADPEHSFFRDLVLRAAQDTAGA
nr:LysR family transcriptional regulator [Kineococcus siccus]